MCSIFAILEIAAFGAYWYSDFTSIASDFIVGIAIILSIISLAVSYFLSRAMEKRKILFFQCYMGYFVIKCVVYLLAFVLFLSVINTLDSTGSSGPSIPSGSNGISVPNIQLKPKSPNGAGIIILLVAVFIIYPWRVLRMFWKIIGNLKQTNTNAIGIPLESWVTNFSTVSETLFQISVCFFQKFRFVNNDNQSFKPGAPTLGGHRALWPPPPPKFELFAWRDRPTPPWCLPNSESCRRQCFKRSRSFISASFKCSKQKNH